jgi:integrase
MTFREDMEACFEAKRHQWRNEKHGDQWRMTLDVYAARLLDMQPAEITTADILAVLKPIWQTKPATAGRLRGRIEMVLDYARALGHISEDKANVARWKNHLDALLAKRTRLSRGHHKAMPFAEVPDFVAKLREIDTTGARALELIILTAARMNEVLRMTKDEIDWERRIWTVPATRIKSTRPHRVPLVDRALEIVREASAASDSDYVFGGHRHGRPVSPTALTMTLKRLEANATCHGFRSSFADWRGDATRYPRELAEAALAHIIGDQTEAAYRRGDALERRREMMEAWSAFIDRTSGEVLQFSRPS